MPGDEVSIDTIPELQAALYIKKISRLFSSEIGHPNTLLHSEKIIILRSNMSQRHTCSIVSDTLPLKEYIRKSILYTKMPSFSAQYFCLMFDDSRKHRREKFIF
jgi:hypothetical protein